MTAKQIEIRVGQLQFSAELADNVTAETIWEALPFEGRINRWGEEIYFSIPVNIELAPDARQEMRIGELAYWPGGSAFCIFFGPTPVSLEGEPRAYTDVNPFGRIIGDATPFTQTADGESIKVKQAKP